MSPDSPATRPVGSRSPGPGPTSATVDEGSSVFQVSVAPSDVTEVALASAMPGAPAVA